MSSATFVVQSLYKRPGLVSLEEARRRPEIVYHSIRHLASPKKAAPTSTATPGVISLEEARRRPEIVYHSIRHLATPKKAAPTPTAAPVIPTINIAPATPTRTPARAGRRIRTPPRPVFMMGAVRMAAQPRRPVLTVKPEAAIKPESAMTLIPLSVAAARKDIKYRQEGFEMKERKVAAKNRQLHKRIIGSNVI